VKHVKNIAGMVLVGLFMEFGVKAVQTAAITTWVSGVEGGLTLDAWAKQWSAWATYAILAGLGTFLFWYVAGQYILQPDFSGTSSKRPVWILFIVGPVIIAEIGVILLPAAQSFEWMAYAFLFFNAVFSYWLASAMFSPSLVKTAPIGYEWPRRLSDGLPL
jgi:hypothetical protein